MTLSLRQRFVRWLMEPLANPQEMPRLEECLHPANGHGMMEGMDTSTARFALVPTRELDDLLELARLAAGRLPDSDSLGVALRGSAAQVRLVAVLEPWEG